jgi:hypothetical protein
MLSRIVLPLLSLLSLLLCLSLIPTATAAPLTPEQIPEPLKPWVGWVLWDQRERACPPAPDDAGARQCVWPGRLELDLDERAGRFKLQVRTYAEAWVPLPGDAEHWPSGVEADGQPGLVEAQDERPGLRLAAGVHAITGRFAWDRLPESLSIPDHAGLVALVVQGRPVPIPAFNDEGALWIHHGSAPAAPAAADTLSLKVFRRVADGVPVQAITHIDLDVSGRPREALLQGALLADAIPLEVTSPLPARLEPDGRLRVQVRPGRWPIDIAARFPGEVAALALPALPEPWPSEEIWTFAADPAARLVEIEGVPPVDPRQTELPEAWKGLPAYRLEPGTALAFKQIRRGDPEPEPDSLTLHRRLWLDFDGQGYTVNDQIGGRMTRGWRLNAGEALSLGRVSLDGQPQSITRDEQTGGVGVEVRRGALDLSADSRLPGVRVLPAAGWDQDFRKLSYELNLPPGWRLFTATGVDAAPGTWTSAWTLLDLFMVLIAALAVGRLWGWPWAGLALAALALLWQEPDAPRYVWLHLLAAAALLRALPPGRAALAVRWYRNLAALVLALIALPFMADRIRFGLYPQLQQPWRVQEASAVGDALEMAAKPALLAPATAPEPMSPPMAEMPAQMAPAPVPAPMEEMDSEAQPQVRARAFRAPKREVRTRERNLPLPGSVAAAPPSKLREIDPNAVTQTGPGLPQWRWTTVALAWNGPVPRGQELRLVLLPPAANLALNLLSVLLLLGLAWLLIGGKPPDWRRFRPGGAAPLLPLLLLPLLFGFLPEAKADFPSPELLETLRARLLAPPECQPECAEIPLLRLQTSPAELRETLDIEALAQTAVPLPARLGQWLPSRAEVDGKPTEALFRDGEGTLWLALEPGRHAVTLAGPLPQREQVQLPLPLKPRRVEAGGEGWQVEGIRDHGVPDVQLQLLREARESGPEAAALEARPLPPFLEVRRVLRFGLDWRVDTLVRRMSPADGPAAAEIPLLPGESVVTAGLHVKDGKVAVNLLPGQAELAWESALDPQPQIALAAPEVRDWTEVWQADVSPIWHLEAEGLAVVHHQDPEGRWLPEWRPWPGETVSLRLTRPVGVAGNTLTLDASELRLSPGERASDASLTLRLRSSQGGRHEVKLPEGATLQSVVIDGAVQPIRQQGRAVSLPIRPGAQTATLSWRSAEGIAAWLSASAADLGAPSVNAATHIDLGHDRWVLLLGGPTLGPAVLFWGTLALILLLAWGLGRLALSPLKSWQWGLLLVGLSQIPAFGGLLVVGWLLALAWRAGAGRELGDNSFNALQIGLALLTLAALAALLEAVRQGLLGLPSMQVAGNGSGAYSLNWYQDRAGSEPPRPWILSAPLWMYRTLMLAWALWLAYSLLDWLRWGWSAYAADGLWRARTKPPEEDRGEG